LTKADPCPKDWTQAPNGGDCFYVMAFFDSFDGNNYIPETFDDAEAYCISHVGELLASIHSREEQDFVMGMYCQNGGASRNIGLKCKERDCNWVTVGRTSRRWSKAVLWH
ncbi:hypothetical protein PENTCL1PPCAC_854, partial [Pristionchus entomophagus]